MSLHRTRHAPSAASGGAQLPADNWSVVPVAAPTVQDLAET